MYVKLERLKDAMASLATASRVWPQSWKDARTPSRKDDGGSASASLGATNSRPNLGVPARRAPNARARVERDRCALDRPYAATSRYGVDPVLWITCVLAPPADVPLGT